MNTPGEADAAERLLDRLHEFAELLGPEERIVLASLLAPGIASAYEMIRDDVVGFGEGARPPPLAEAIAAEVRRRRFEVGGL